GERDGVALRSSSSKRLHAGAEKLGLLAPHSAAIGEHPCGASTIVVGRPADHGRAAVAGERDGKALPGGTYRVGSNQLGLLGPRPGAASEYPCRPYLIVVEVPTFDGGVAVGRQCDRGALLGVSQCTGTDQFGLLAPHAAAAGEHPYCAAALAVAGSSDQCCVA